MDSPPVQALVERYRQALSKLDSMQNRLSETEQNRYRKLRANFLAQLSAWENVSTITTNQIVTNLQESYYEIEALWYNRHRSKQLIS